MHLVGFIIRIFHEARSPESQKKNQLQLVINVFVNYFVRKMSADFFSSILVIHKFTLHH